MKISQLDVKEMGTHEMKNYNGGGSLLCRINLKDHSITYLDPKNKTCVRKVYNNDPIPLRY